MIKCQNDQWFTEEYGFFGEFYYISDDSSEGPYRSQKQSRDKRTEVEVALISKLLGVKPGERLFDWPCGWGRHSLRLAQQGLNVTAIDINGYHLDRFREALQLMPLEVQEHIEIRKNDMRKPLNGVEQHDYGINMFSSFGFFGDDENRQTLENFSRSLRPGGKLLIHLDFNAYRLLHGDYEDYSARRTIRFKGTNYVLDVHKSYCQEDKRLHGLWCLTDEMGNREEKEYSFRIYSEAEWLALLTGLGFTDIAFYSTKGELQTPDDIDTVIVATKTIPSPHTDTNCID